MTDMRELPESRSFLAQCLYSIAMGCHTYASEDFLREISGDPTEVEEQLGKRVESIIEIQRIALNIGDPLSLEAHTILELIGQLYGEAIERFGCFANFPKYDASEMEFSYAYAALRSDLSWVENYRERLEITAARLVTAELVSAGSRYDEPLTKRAEAVYQIILEFGPIIGREIIGKLDECCHEDIGGIDQSTLTKDIIPELKMLRGVRNKPGVGYYDPQSSARK